MNTLPISLALGLALLVPGLAMSAPQTFYGFNGDTGIAYDAFIDSVDGGLMTESFDDFERQNIAKSEGLEIAFGTIQGSSDFMRVEDEVELGRHPVSGSNYLLTSTSYFDLTFNTSVAAFGFYGIDIGDYTGQLVMQVFFEDQGDPGAQYLLAGGTTPGTAGNDGNVFFWGMSSADSLISRIRFWNTHAYSVPANRDNADWFAFDDMSVIQAKGNDVPEPASLALLGLGLSALGWRRLRARRATVA